MGDSRSLSTKQPYNSIAFRILVAVVWTYNTVFPLVKAVFATLPYIGVLADLLIPMSIFLTTMASLPWFLSRVHVSSIVVYVGAVMVVLFTMILHPATVDYLQEEWWRILVAAVPMYFIGISFDLENSKNDLFWCSLFSVLGMFIFRIYLLNSGRNLENDDMEAAYRMLPSIMYLIYYASVKKQVVYVAIAAAASLVILIFGTRGPIVCILVYVAVLTIYLTLKSRNAKKLIILLIVFAIILSVFISDTLFIKVATTLSDRFEDIGFSTRIFNFIIEGDITESRGRAVLAENTKEAILQNPLWGYGITGDRALMGIYPHNIFLEILCQYGVIFGSLLIVAIVAVTIMALIKTRKDSKRFSFALMLVSLVFVKLMISSTYTIEPILYFMMGYFALTVRKKN